MCHAAGAPLPEQGPAAGARLKAECAACTRVKARVKHAEQDLWHAVPEWPPAAGARFWAGRTACPPRLHAHC